MFKSYYILAVAVSAISTSAAAQHYPAVVKKDLTLCSVPKDRCGIPESSANSTVCGTSSSKCRPKQAQVLKGEPVCVVANKPKDALREWVFLRGRWCDQSHKLDATGWVRRSEIVPLAKFTRMRSWSSESTFEIETGDYTEMFTINPNGTFSLSGGERGAMYAHGDLIWARLYRRKSIAEFIFIPVEGGGKHCWVTNLKEVSFMDKKYNCFKSPVGVGL